MGAEDGEADSRSRFEVDRCLSKEGQTDSVLLGMGRRQHGQEQGEGEMGGVRHHASPVRYPTRKVETWDWRHWHK